MQKDTRYRTKKPKSRTTDPSGHSKTNSLSVTGSSDAPAIERIYAKADARDVINYKAVDRRAEADLCRKTRASGFVSREPRWHNQDQKQKCRPTPLPKPPKIAWLPSVHRNLYIADLDWVLSDRDDGHLRELGISLVINMSHHDVRYKVNSHRIPIQDSRKVHYPTFRKAMDAIGMVLNTALRRRKVLVHCRAGTNRSVSGVIAYAIKYRGANPQDVAISIKQDKESAGYQHWDTLTNGTFWRYLHAYHQECNK